MTKPEALQILENMSENQFQEFYKSLPYRVQICCGGGLVDWKEVLPRWWIKHQEIEEVSNGITQT